MQGPDFVGDEFDQRGCVCSKINFFSWNIFNENNKQNELLTELCVRELLQHVVNYYSVKFK